jgi:RimJ/RimL family protein N-acetyltransferase/methionyl-tRNA formyltransferase
VILDRTLETEHLLLRSLSLDDVGDRYVGWLNDREVTRFLEVRHLAHTIDSTRRIVSELNESSHSLLLGVFVKATGRHIGNIKLGPIDPTHLHAYVGIMLGDKTEWGKGLGPEAIVSLANHSFGELGLVKLQAGCYGSHVGSQRAFLKAGFAIEGRLAGYWREGPEREDQIVLGLTSEAHAARTVALSPRRFGHVDRVTLIGGGDLMLHAARQFARTGLPVSALLAPRHAAETLPLDGRLTGDALAETGAAVVVVPDMNSWTPAEPARFDGDHALALCFGPAWIFSKRVRAWFGGGMINVNAIPLPRFVGGAHYTWQILQGDREGGCFLQAITDVVDRGPILQGRRFILPAWAQTPRDHVRAYHLEGCVLIDEFIAAMREDRLFSLTPFDALEAERLYFPKLRTLEQGYIDWSWKTHEIEAFCRAFDDPYPGAGTFLSGREVRLFGVHRLAGSSEPFHPFAAGLIVRYTADGIFVASLDGLLRVDRVVARDGGECLALIREGRRFTTPPEILHRALTYRACYGGGGSVDE